MDITSNLFILLIFLIDDRSVNILIIGLYLIVGSL